MNWVGINSALLALRVLGTASAYVIGAVLLVWGLNRARQIPEGRTTAFGVVMPAFSGISLIYLASALHSLNESLFGIGHPLDWVQNSDIGSSSSSVAAFQVMLLLLQVAGVFAVIRGFLLLSRAGDPQQRDHRSVSAGITYLLGGAGLLNIQQLALAFSHLLGAGTWAHALQTAIRQIH